MAAALLGCVGGSAGGSRCCCGGCEAVVVVVLLSGGVGRGFDNLEAVVSQMGN